MIYRLLVQGWTPSLDNFLFFDLCQNFNFAAVETIYIIHTLNDGAPFRKNLNELTLTVPIFPNDMGNVGGNRHRIINISTSAWF